MTDENIFFIDILDQIERGDARDFSVTKKRRGSTLNTPVESLDEGLVNLVPLTEPCKLILNILDKKERNGGEY